MSVAAAYMYSPVSSSPFSRLSLRDGFNRITSRIAAYVSEPGEPTVQMRLDLVAVATLPYQRIEESDSVYTGSSIAYVGDSSMDLNMKSIAKLDSFLNLPENWNGYGAKQFSPSYIEYAKSLLIKLPAKAEVFPISDGRVQFEFDKDNGAYLELEINSDKTVGVFEILDDKSEREYKTRSEETVRIVTEFYE